MARLLWRGSLHLEPDRDDGGHVDHDDPQLANGSLRSLHGLAIVASSFKLVSRAVVEPDDPFSSSSSPFKPDSAAELCLDIEMLRNAPLYFEPGRARVLVKSSDKFGEQANLPPNLAKQPHGRKALKQSIEMLRKGKQRSSIDAPELVYLDDEDSSDANLSLYVDQRCNETVEYFNNIFCREAVDPETGRTRVGLAIPLERIDELGVSSASIRRVVVYGQIKSNPHASQPILQLHVAKYRNKKQLASRPDAPAPRENLFAQKLRRTVSQPALQLKTAEPTKPVPPSKAAIAKDRPPLARAQSTTSLHIPKTSKARNLFGPPAIAPNDGKSAASGKASLMRAPLGHSSPGRRGQKRSRLTAGGLKALEEEEDGDEHVSQLGCTDDTKPVKRARDGSPTPSVATVRSIASNNAAARRAPNGRAVNGSALGAKGQSLMKRSMSMPPGQLQFGTKAPQSRNAREASLAPTEITLNNGDEGAETSLETRNRGTMRKVLLASMTARSCGRDHEDFKEVFSVAYKGLQCAFRHSIKTDKLEKEAISACTEQHLSMYLGPMNPPV